MRFLNSRVPHCSCIYKNVRKYELCETDKYQSQSRSVRSAKNCQQELQLIFSFPTKPKASARRNNVPDIRKSSLNRITRKDLNWHPFKINCSCRRYIVHVRDCKADFPVAGISFMSSGESMHVRTSETSSKEERVSSSDKYALKDWYNRIAMCKMCIRIKTFLRCIQCSLILEIPVFPTYIRHIVGL